MKLRETNSGKDLAKKCPPVSRLRHNERGEGKFGCIFMLLLTLSAGYVGYMFSIPWFEYNSFEGRISEMMPYYRNHKAEYVHKGVTDIAKEFGIKLNHDQVKVQVLQRENRLIIDLNYSRTVTLPFYVHNVKFKPHFTGTVY